MAEKKIWQLRPPNGGIWVVWGAENLAVPLATPIKAAPLLKKRFPCAVKIRWVAPSPLVHVAEYMYLCAC